MAGSVPGTGETLVRKTVPVLAFQELIVGGIGKGAVPLIGEHEELGKLQKI